ncbi:MAG: aquaporin [Dehalococcoidia bacterium]
MTDYQNLAAEAVGTFTLIFVGVGAVVASGNTDTVAIALAHGIAFAVMVSTLGHVSGGLFNPALTIGLWATRRLSAMDTGLYVAAQLAGGILAAILLVLLLPQQMRDLVNLGTPALADGVNFAQGVGIEAILTAFLMLAVFGTSIDSRAPRMGGLFIGLVLVMDIAAGGRLTGAALNPARAIAPALASGTFGDQLVYWIGPILGAVGGAALYEYVFIPEEERATVAP